LERQKNSVLCAHFGVQLEEILPVVADGSFRHLVRRISSDYLRERGLPRTVRSHDSVDFARVYTQRDALENFPIADAGVQIIYF